MRSRPKLVAGALKILTVIGFWQLGIWGSAALLAWLMMRRTAAQASDRAAIGSLGILGFVLRVLVWTLVALLALDNLGIDITALVAGLGVGGIVGQCSARNRAIAFSDATNMSVSPALMR